MPQCEDSDRTTQPRIRQALDAGQPSRGDILNRSKSGPPSWINLDIQPLRDSQGRHVGFIGINSDVTDRRETSTPSTKPSCFTAPTTGWCCATTSTARPTTAHARQWCRAPDLVTGVKQVLRSA